VSIFNNNLFVIPLFSYNHYMKKLISTLLLCFSTLSFGEIAKNAIYFIGDGMGPSIVTAARVYQYGSQGTLYMESFPFTGFSRTFSSDDVVTDSAAGATALLTGVKVVNETLGVTDAKLDPKKVSRNLQNIMDVAKAAGKSIGVVTTTETTHATPAGAYAHINDRNKGKKIAKQLLESDLDLLLGGGAKHFSKKTLKKLKAKNWMVINHKNELKDTKQKVLGLFHLAHLTYMTDRKAAKVDTSEPTLTEMVDYAIKYLRKNPKGYLLLVEGGRIDHAAHDNLAEKAFVELVEFDHAIKRADDMTNDKDTLLVITADHDTGNLSLNGYGPHDVKGKDLLGNIKHNKYGDSSHLSWATGPGAKSPTVVPKDTNVTDYFHRAAIFGHKASHTAVDVPVLAKGPGAQAFSGYQNNNQIPVKLLKSLGLKFTDQVNLAQPNFGK
jgi:alkaline phosphatase